jgi:undecaprenyl-diphosphatase
MEHLLAAILGLVEGLTEFIPVSSTGHLILADHLLGFQKLVDSDPKVAKEIADAFEVFIQLGAVLAVVLAYPRRFTGLLRLRENQGFSGLRGIGLLVLTTLPAAVVGLTFRHFIKDHLFNSTGVATSLLVGGLWILIVERLRLVPRREGLDAITWRDALHVGLFQCLALWPGMSRSAATILGGMIGGLERRTATEYSFFAAVAVIPAAGLFELYKALPYLRAAHVLVFVIGTLVSFVSAWAAVQFLIRYVSQHTLSAFGWYRLVLAALVLWWSR